MEIAREDLRLERSLVVYPGSRHSELSERIRAEPLVEALTETHSPR